MIRAAVPADAALAAGLALRLWPGHTEEELTAEMAELISSSEAVIFLAFEECRAVGFAQVQLRRDYVEGTTSSPVGYLEGIYVEETYRRRGIASRLTAAGEQWSAEQGCREFASSCEADNLLSAQFHRGAGFQDAGCIQCFVKSLNSFIRLDISASPR